MSLIKYASKVSALTLLSRLMGFVRDAILAQSFGAKSGFDLFLLAFKVPNMMRRIFAEGAFSQAFIPVLAEYEEQSPDRRKDFLNAVYSCLGIVTILLTVVVCMGCELALRWGSPWLGQSPRMALFLRLLQVTFPYLVLMTITGFYSAALQARKQFSMAALTPTFFNIVFSLGALLSSMYLSEPIYGAAVTVLVGGVMQVALMGHGYLKLYGMPKMTLSNLDTGVFKLFRLMCAGMYGASVAQIGMAIDSVILSMLTAGSVSWIYYAERLSYLPLGVFGASIVTVLSPSLAKSCQANDTKRFQKQVAWGVISAGIIGIPSAIGLSILAKPVVATLFLRGKFTLHDVNQTAAALQVFALGIPAYMWIKVFAGAFYARQETWIPVQCATAALGVNVAIGCVGAYYLAHVGIAYAVAASAYANAALLYWQLNKSHVFQFTTNDIRKLTKVATASMFTFASVGWLPEITLWIDLTMLSQLVYLSTALCLSLAGYGALLWVMALDWRSPSA